MKKANKPMAKALTTKDTITYSMGSLGRELSNNCINIFFLAYLNIYMGLDALVLTIAFVVARIWDAVNDPLIATLVNNTKKSKWGRFRPWMAVGAMLNALSLILMFTPLTNVSEIVKYVYYISMFFIWGMTFTLVDIPFWSMIPTLADSTQERNKISSLAKLVGGFGGFIITSVGTSLILPMLSGRGMTTAYFVLGLFAGVMMFCFMSVTIICNKEIYEVPNKKVNLKEILDLFRKNDQLVVSAISSMTFLAAITIALAQTYYLFVYNYENGTNFFNHSYSYTLYFVIACTGQGLAMFFYNALTKKIARQKLFGSTFIMSIIGMVGMFFIFFALKEGKHLVNTLLVAITSSFLMLAAGLNSIGLTVMLADIVDYNEWKNDKRADSIIFGIGTFLAKSAGSVAMLLLGIGIKVSNLPEIVDKANEDGTWSQYFVDSAGNILSSADISSGNSLTILRVFMFLIPIPLCIIGYIIYKRKYFLFADRYDKIKAEIDERRKSTKKDVQIENDN